MKKINNKGWGLSTMLIFMGIFVLFIIIVAIISYNYGIDKNSPDPIYSDTSD